MIHTTAVEWHDLIEDPTDLPKKQGIYYGVAVDVLLWISGGYSPIGLLNDDIFEYQPEDKVWSCSYEEYGEYAGELYFESYKTPATEGMKDDIDKQLMIVAWANPVKLYIPQKPQGF